VPLGATCKALAECLLAHVCVWGGRLCAICTSSPQPSHPPPTLPTPLQVAHYLLLTHLHTSGTVPPMADLSTILPRRCDERATLRPTADVAALQSNRRQRMRATTQRSINTQLNSLARALRLPDLELFSDLEARGLGCGILDLDDTFDADDDDEAAEGFGGPSPLVRGGGLGGPQQQAPSGLAAAGGAARVGGSASGAQRGDAATGQGAARGGSGGDGRPSPGAEAAAGSNPTTPARTAQRPCFEGESLPLGPEDALLPEEEGVSVVQPPPVRPPLQQPPATPAAALQPDWTAEEDPSLQKQQQQLRQSISAMELDDGSTRHKDFPSADAPGYGRDGSARPAASAAPPLSPREAALLAVPRPRARVPRWLRDTSLGRRSEAALERAAAAAAMAATMEVAPPPSSAAVRAASGLGVGGHRSPLERNWAGRDDYEGGASPAKRHRPAAAGNEMEVDGATEQEGGAAAGGSAAPGEPEAPLSPNAAAAAAVLAAHPLPPTPQAAPTRTPWRPDEDRSTDRLQQQQQPGSLQHAPVEPAIGVYQACLADIKQLLAVPDAAQRERVTQRAVVPLLERCLDLYFQWDEARAVVDGVQFPDAPGELILAEGCTWGLAGPAGWLVGRSALSL